MIPRREHIVNETENTPAHAGVFSRREDDGTMSGTNPSLATWAEEHRQEAGVLVGRIEKIDTVPDKKRKARKESFALLRAFFKFRILYLLQVITPAEKNTATPSTCTLICSPDCGTEYAQADSLVHSSTRCNSTVPPRSVYELFSDSHP